MGREEKKRGRREKKRNKRRMERKVEAGLDFRLTLGGGKGAIKIGGIRNKEKEEEKPEADRN